MNNPLYAAGLAVFVVLQFVFGFPVPLTVLLSLGAVLVVLLVQGFGLPAPGPTRVPVGGGPPPERAALRSLRSRVAIHGILDGTFLGLSWAIFWAARGPSPAAIEPVRVPTWLAPPTGSGHWVLLLGLTGGLVLAIAALWSIHVGPRWIAARDRLPGRAPSPPAATGTIGTSRPLPTGTARCAFREAYAFALGPVDPPRGIRPDLHAGALQPVLFRSHAGGPPQPFAICVRHRTDLVRLEVFTGLRLGADR